MAYCTETDLVTRFGEAEIIQLTDREAYGEINASVLERAIIDAAAEIDGFLAGRYTLPLAAVPINLTRIACDIARYYLYENAATQIVIDRYAAATRYLELVAKGSITLGPDADGDKQTADSGTAVIASDLPVMTAADALW